MNDQPCNKTTALERDVQSLAVEEYGRPLSDTELAEVLGKLIDAIDMAVWPTRRIEKHG